MKIKRISYLFALCPAMLAGLTSCNKGPLPGKALTYEETYAQVLKTAPEYNYRTSLAKSIDVNMAIDDFTIDGKVTVPDGEPTNIRFTMPKQDNFKMHLANENGVVGALQVMERVKRDAKVPNLAIDNNLTALNRAGGGGQFGGNTLVNFLFNPFFTTYTLSYIHEIVSTCSNFNIVNENFSLDGETVYVQYSIPDLKTFTQIAEEYELKSLHRLFTVFRGKDGNVSMTLGFDKCGYLNVFNIKADSTDISFVGDSDTNEETFRGYAKVDVKATIKQNFYEDSDYHTYSVVNRLGNSQLTTRQATLDEYRNMGFNGRKLEAQFVESALPFYDTILPGYGTDFVIEHAGKTSKLDNITVSFGGIEYPVTRLIERGDVALSYNWSSKNATIGNNKATNGRSLVYYKEECEDKNYYADKNYSLLPYADYSYRFHNASLLEEALNIETSNGHKHNPVSYFIQNDGSIGRKEYFNLVTGGDVITGLGKTLHFQQIPFTQDFSTSVNAFPYGYVHYNFRMSDFNDLANTGIVFGSSTTRSSFAIMGDGTSHGILDIYNNLQEDGSYKSPIIRPAPGFKFNERFLGDENNFKEGLFHAYNGDPNTQFFKALDGDFARLMDSVSIIPVGDFNNLEGFQFVLTKDYIEHSKEFTRRSVETQLGPCASFTLTDFPIDNDMYHQNGLFIRANNDEYKPEGTHYIDFSIFNYYEPLNDCGFYNPKNGLEEGSIKATVKRVETSEGEANGLEFEDIVIAADDGYVFDQTLARHFEASRSYIYRPVIESEPNIFHGYEQNSEISAVMFPFAKLSDDRKQLTISMDNFKGSVEEKNRLLIDLYNVFERNRSNHAKFVFNPIKEEQPYYYATESEIYMSVVPGANYTYVQILPLYCSEIDKDMEIILDF